MEVGRVEGERGGEDPCFQHTFDQYLGKNIDITITFDSFCIFIIVKDQRCRKQLISTTVYKIKIVVTMEPTTV